MKTIAFAIAILSVGCASVTVVPGAEKVKITKVATDVVGCKPLGFVEADVPNNTGDDIHDMQNQAFVLGADTVLMTATGNNVGAALFLPPAQAREANRRKGVAYQCRSTPIQPPESAEAYAPSAPPPNGPICGDCDLGSQAARRARSILLTHDKSSVVGCTLMGTVAGAGDQDVEKQNRAYWLALKSHAYEGGRDPDLRVLFVAGDEDQVYSCQQR